MDELLKSLSNLSKTISQDIEFSNTCLSELISDCLSELKYVPRFSSVKIETGVDVNMRVMTDKSLVEIVMKCLLANAITFRSPAREGLITIQTSVDDDSFQIEISDDGVGISDAIKDKIFDMFYRGSELSTGAGLGLYIVKKIVAKLKGSLEFTSSNGLTRFLVICPNNKVLIAQ